MNTTSTSTNSSERTANGQFAKGNPGGRGNPFARKVASFRAAIINAVTPADLAQILEVFRQKALQGDYQAAKFVFQYSAGKPADAGKVNPDRLDLEEFQLQKESMIENHEVDDILTHVNVKVATELLEVLAPMALKGYFQKVGWPMGPEWDSVPVYHYSGCFAKGYQRPAYDSETSTSEKTEGQRPFSPASPHRQPTAPAAEAAPATAPRDAKANRQPTAPAAAAAPATAPRDPKVNRLPTGFAATSDRNRNSSEFRYDPAEADIPGADRSERAGAGRHVTGGGNGECAGRGGDIGPAPLCLRFRLHFGGTWISARRRRLGLESAQGYLRVF